MLYRILRDNLPTHAQMHVLRLVHTTCTVRKGIWRYNYNKSALCRIVAPRELSDINRTSLTLLCGLPEGAALSVVPRPSVRLSVCLSVRTVPPIFPK